MEQERTLWLLSEEYDNLFAHKLGNSGMSAYHFYMLLGSEG